MKQTSEMTTADWLEWQKEVIREELKEEVTNIEG
ncbi:hypothetical protein BkAM31D_02260 [Halalkalibacter krulwichiae]|uniref:Uncharacterized protein n=1 Tax=Halalkalibacter krulwichiae TaxID=199441 RepID=A0A1X9M5N5_9BACI|nr:hypothetical protein BkAM31D_02260 [Halalkalibacter krulwichiae]